MTDPQKIPYLIKLLDDESESVQSCVVQELSSFGPLLKQELQSLPFPLSDLQKNTLEEILRSQQRTWLKRMWRSWLWVKAEDRMEKALALLSEYLCGPGSNLKLSYLLDELAEEYRRTHSLYSPELLIKFLFLRKGFTGNEADYYNPQNSNLVYVIQQRKGIPVSLGSVLMLVGKRLGFSIKGCNFPGHFLSVIERDGKRLFVDCFNKGQIFERDDILRGREGSHVSLRDILAQDIDTPTIIKRFLANIVRAYQYVEDEENCAFMIGLFKDIEEGGVFIVPPTVKSQETCESLRKRFVPGQLIYHKVYGYRGVVVEADLQCRATDSWYYGNQTQPNRCQPWYHVLVHDSDHVTYVAESSIVMDDCPKKVVHPLLSCFFIEVDEGHYIRNDTPWPDAKF